MKSFLGPLRERLKAHFSSPFWTGFLSGLASMGYILAPPRYRFRKSYRRKFQKPLTTEEAMRQDGEALRRDWEMIGNDMRKAIDKAKAEYANVESLSEARRKRKEKKETR